MLETIKLKAILVHCIFTSTMSFNLVRVKAGQSFFFNLVRVK